MVSYTNPVVTPVAADPSIIRAPDGTFYLYATQDDWGDGNGSHYLPIFRSSDLVNWEHLGDAFAGPAPWKSGGGFLWAPDISHYRGTYYLYYAASLWGDENPCIGLATAAAPEGPWSDLGRPVFCSQEIGVKNSIDPFAWNEEGRRYLIWGSFGGIYLVALSDDGSEPAGEPVLLADTRFEAPYLVKRDGHYYLFLSSGSCCDGGNSTYTTWVGRAEKLEGPYLDASGRDLRYGGSELVLYRNDAWVGPGHNSLVTDDASEDWLVYHAIPTGRPVLPSGATRRPALIDRIDWSSGWPVVNGGDGPSAAPQPAPTVTPR